MALILGFGCRASPITEYERFGALIDLPDGCGHPMYARTSGERPLYVCGRYLKSSGVDCEHNYVDGEAADPNGAGRIKSERVSFRNIIAPDSVTSPTEGVSFTKVNRGD